MVNKQQFLHKIMELNPNLNHTLINWTQFWLLNSTYNWNHYVIEIECLKPLRKQRL